MSRNCQALLLSLFGWLFIGASNPRDEAQAFSNQSNESVPKTAPAAPTRSSVQTVQTSMYQPPCRDPRDIGRCDLEAQWKAADAGDKAAWWAVVQAVLSAAGVVGLVASLYYTRKAVKVAEDATNDADDALAIARRNADAAFAQVQITQEVAHAQARAYLSVKPVSAVTTAEGHLKFTIGIRNSGQSPARSAQAIITAYLKEDGGRKTLPSSLQPLADIGAGEAVTAELIIEVDGEMARLLATKRCAFDVEADLTYHTVFSDKLETEKVSYRGRAGKGIDPIMTAHLRSGTVIPLMRLRVH